MSSTCIRDDQHISVRPAARMAGVVKYLTLRGAIWLGVAAPARARSVTPRRGSPDQGQAPTILAEASAAAAELDRIRSLLVSWRGSLIVERYYNGARASTPANIKSAAKSVISALVGIAIDRKSIAGVRQ